MSAPPKPFYAPLPLSATTHGQLCTTESAVLACWPASYAPVARAALDRHPPSGVVVHGGERRLSRWHARWLAARVAGVMRCDARELIELADAQLRREGDAT